MGGGITGIDHLLVGVRDLEGARRAYETLGFTVSPRGRHIGWGTANYCVMLDGGYIELLGIIDPAQFTNRLDTFLAAREGLLGIAFATDDAPQAARALADRQIATDGPKDLSRLLEHPDGVIEPAFRLVHLPDEATPIAPAFLCQHLTPELVWQSPWLDHANGAAALISVTGAVADVGDVALRGERLFGPAAVSAGGGIVEIDSGRGVLRFTTEAGLTRLYPGLGRLPQHGAPWLAGLRLAVHDLDETAHRLASAGLPAIRDGGSLLRVGPEFAAGAVIEFATR